MTGGCVVDHVQVAIPPHRENDARRFYRDLLGLAELPKPSGLAERGGVWFGAGAVHLHLGVEQEFRPARKAHVAFRVPDLETMRRALAQAGFPTTADHALAGIARFYTQDPFGNRTEFMAG